MFWSYSFYQLYAYWLLHYVWDMLWLKMSANCMMKFFIWSIQTSLFSLFGKTINHSNCSPKQIYCVSLMKYEGTRKLMSPWFHFVDLVYYKYAENPNCFWIFNLIAIVISYASILITKWHIIFLKEFQ